MKLNEVINNDKFAVITGRVDNSDIVHTMYFYAFENNHDGTYTTFTEYYRGCTYSCFWVERKRRNFVAETYTREELIEKFKDCECMDDTSPY